MHLINSYKNLKLSYFRVKFIYKCFYSLHFDGQREEKKSFEFENLGKKAITWDTL